MKPILFNTGMVRAILEGRKTVTRRVVKPQLYKVCFCGAFKNTEGEGKKALAIANKWEELEWLFPPYRPSDILYVRETFWKGVAGVYEYKADYEDNPGYVWTPSIHMPREAARIFLRVKDVRVERLQDITEEQAIVEGVPEDGDYPLENPVYCLKCKGEGLLGSVHPVSLGYMDVDCPYCDTPKKRFSNLWDSTIKPKDSALYGWDANPWVWVITFERCKKPEDTENLIQNETN